MPAKQAETVGVSDSGSRVASCTFDEAGLPEQRSRFERLAPTVTGITREPEAVRIFFREGFDRDLLDRAVAVENHCCPFFQFELDEEARRLRVTVQHRDQLPALDVIAHALASG
jgi:hypothetical protein